MSMMMVTEGEKKPPTDEEADNAANETSKSPPVESGSTSAATETPSEDSETVSEAMKPAPAPRVVIVTGAYWCRVLASAVSATQQPDAGLCSASVSFLLLAHPARAKRSRGGAYKMQQFYIF